MVGSAFNLKSQEITTTIVLVIYIIVNQFDHRFNVAAFSFWTYVEYFELKAVGSIFGAHCTGGLLNYPGGWHNIYVNGTTSANEKKKKRIGNDLNKITLG